MLKFVKRLAVLSIALLIAFSAAVIFSDTARAAVKYGLTVDASGTILLNGKAFYGAGVNCFPTFIRHKDNMMDETYKEDFAMMKKYNVPFVRIPLCGYWPSEYELYADSPEIFFAAMDNIVREAEKQNIGIIASLFWWDAAVPDFVGEPRSKVGDPSSKTVAFVKKYVSQIVPRYKDSPAIWGWEIGNEFNLSADIMDSRAFPQIHPGGGTPATRSLADCVTADQISTYYKEIGKEIRKYDTYRLITTGDGEMRPASYHMSKSGGSDWNYDTFEQFKTMLGKFTPSPLNTICFHFQHPESDLMYERFAPSEGKKPEKIYILDYLKGYVKAAKELKKGAFYGEFGDMMEWTDSGKHYQNNLQLMKDNFYKVSKAIQDSGLQLSAIWMFRYDGAYQAITDTTDEKFKLVEISQMNKNYIAKNIQSTAGYWPEYKEPVSSTSASKSGSSSKNTNTSSKKPAASTGGESTGSPNTSQDNTAEVESSYIPFTELNNLIRAKDSSVVFSEEGKAALKSTMTLREFRNQVNLAVGCTIELADTNGNVLKSMQTKLKSNMQIRIYKDEELKYTLTLVVPADSSSASTGNGTEKGGFLWLWITIGALVLLGGAFALLYFTNSPLLKFIRRGSGETPAGEAESAEEDN